MLFTIQSLAFLPISIGRLALAVLRLSQMPEGLWMTPVEKSLSRRQRTRVSYSPDRLRSPAEARRIATIRSAVIEAPEV